MIERPQLFLAALVLLPVLLILWRRYIRGRRDLMSLGGNWLKVDYANLFVVKWFFSSLFYVLFILLAVVAASGIRWGSKPVADERSGQEIIFVFDLSNSMRAEDIIPSRLRRAAVLAKEIAESSPGAKYGVVGFKGHASLLLPMTEDVTALQSLLNALRPEMITSPGTDIEAGLRTGIESFPRVFEAHRIMFLFTDGESLSGDPLAQAQSLKDENIALSVVGMGTDTPSRIPLQNDTYLKDQNGNEITTEMRRDILSQLAETVGGIVHWAADPGVRDELIEEITGVPGGGVWGYKYESTDRYRLFLSLAMLCLTISIGVKVIRWRKIF